MQVLVQCAYFPRSGLCIFVYVSVRLSACSIQIIMFQKNLTSVPHIYESAQLSVATTR